MKPATLLLISLLALSACDSFTEFYEPTEEEQEAAANEKFWCSYYNNCPKDDSTWW